MWTSSDTHTVSNSLVSSNWSGGTTLPSGLDAVLASALTTSLTGDSTASGSGSVAFTFSAADSAFDFLAAGQSLTVIYNVTVTDNTGASSTQQARITIINGPPALAPDNSGPHTITELAGKTGDTVDHDIASGTLTFTDVNLSDTHTVGNNLVSAIWSGGATLPSMMLASALTTSVSSDSTGSGSGAVSFRFSAIDKTFDFLAANQTLTVIYKVTVTDSTGASSAQSVTITITGTNDAPVLDAHSGSLSYTENQPATAIDTAITISDVDSANLVGATVQITSNFVSGQDVLGFANQNGIAGSYNAVTGVLTLTGQASLAESGRPAVGHLFQFQRQSVRPDAHDQLPGGRWLGGEQSEQHRHRPGRRHAGQRRAGGG
jgi:VCBS repeat-containing protein